MVLHAVVLLGFIALALFIMIKVVVFLAEFFIFFAKFLFAAVIVGFVVQVLYWIGLSPVSPLALIL